VSGKTTILVVDDDPQILTMLSIRLSKRGFQVVEACDGLQALEQARIHLPALVLLDVMMPGMNGWEVARELRNDEKLKNVGIVIVSAIGGRVNELTSPLYGADAYCNKPFEFSDLESKIRRVLEERRGAAADA
jgi:DNA-binding response OmpR family regulator